MSDPTLDSFEGNNSASLFNDSYKRGPTPSVFRNITKEQWKINLLKIIDNIRKGYEYKWITKLIGSRPSYYFYSMWNKTNFSAENYTIWVYESYFYRDWIF